MKKLYAAIVFILFSAAASAQLTGLSPNTGFVGQQNLTTTVTSAGLFQTSVSPSGNIWEIYLEQGTNRIPILDNTNMWNFPSPATVVDPNTATLIFSIPPTVPVGSYDLFLTTTDIIWWGSNLQTYSLTSAFTVTPPDGYLTGKVFNDLNGNKVQDSGENGLSGVTITVQPGNIVFTTPASGDFSVGVANGTYTVTYSSSSQHGYILTTDSTTYTRTVANNTQSSLDFGLQDGIISMAPGVYFQGENTNSIVVTRHMLVPGANPWGNIGYAYLVKQVSGQYYNIPTSNFHVLDSDQVQLLYSVASSMPVGMYDLMLYINGRYWHLPSALQVTLAPSYLSGHCYFDVNNNAVYDSGEPPIRYEQFYLSPDSTYSYGNYLGNYTFGAALGTHTLSWVPSSSPYTLSTAPSYTFTNIGNQTGLDFGFRSSLPDYTCGLTYYSGGRRCFSYSYPAIYIDNKSNVVCQGTVYLIKSANETFVNSSPAPTSISGDTIFWSFSGLQPMAYTQINMTFMNPSAGNNVSFGIYLDVKDGSGSVQYSTNRFIAYQITCAYDPNDKSVIPEGVDETMHYTLMTDSLEYTIRFQNTGNDTAFTVVLRDTIDSSLDLNTLEIIGSSHSMDLQINHNRAAKFVFNNILLPDSNVDEPHSHGWVKYRIRPLAGLPDPTRVENQAFIYFDMNPAVETNITWNTLVNFIPVGIENPATSDAAVAFWPNPMDKTGMFTFKNEKSDRMEILVMDLEGRVVVKTSTISNEYQLKRGNLSSGLYLYRILNSATGEIHTGKIAIR